MPRKPQHAKRYKSVPSLLRGFREEAELTQRELGERLKTSHTWVNNAENGNRRVDVAEFADWCRACGLDPVDAFRRFLGVSR